MEQDKLKVEESLNIISEMISTTKYNISQDKVIYLMWGYAVAVSSMTHYVLQYQFGIEMAWLVWLTMPIAGIINGIYFSRKKKKARVVSFTDRALASVWKAFIAALFVFLFASPALGWNGIYPVLMVLYGIGTASTGGIIKFKALSVGGYLSMLVGFAAFYFGFETQLFLLSLSVIVSFIIPGHLLPKKLNV
ncbi:hypothetical protein MATR_30770 [Marivirga tractuosa]|uniref:Transmembrane protein n=1 Tax=Marivirga tractuosa (strain ATCC 23168 / DSM 4126 / NBRC 15989 / NCIMB 1408 / VKM B-1430 / H-43) TaxID=643867 RepID=E4TUI1_MARTH|nr:hypothetical protein [Marivirga tractuosa]ADR23074.1 hypothetical protein Ftrac_3099 [Marivirga tractuosa DSM 4126]BDD16252.1 hypothetical protein MATR_30770 [Marivirga tractuosa]